MLDSVVVCDVPPSSISTVQSLGWILTFVYKHVNWYSYWFTLGFPHLDLHL